MARNNYEAFSNVNRSELGDIFQVPAEDIPAKEAVADATITSGDAAEPGEPPAVEQHGEVTTAEAGADPDAQHADGAQEPGSASAEGGTEGEAAAASGEGEQGTVANGDATAVEGDGASPAEGEPPAEGEVVAAAEEAPQAVEEDAGPPPPPPPPPYIPPEVGDDYIPVSDLPPLPLPYGLNEEGKKIPLPGIESIFLTGGIDHGLHGETWEQHFRH